MSEENPQPLARFFILPVLVAFVVLGIIYSTVVPIFEKPDEIFHYFFVQHLLEERSLPVMGSAGENLWEQEGSQPPLYYLLAAVITSWVDTSDARDLVWVNPQRNLGDPGDPGNKNYIVHTERESWPYRGATLAVHLARWLSLAFGVGTVILVYATARMIFPVRPWLAVAVAALVAFIPQFLFISSAVSNDSLVTFLSALVLFQLVRLVRRPGGNEWAAWAALGITVGLAALTKLSGLALLGLCGLALAWLAWQRRSWRTLFVGGAILVGTTTLIAGWWYLRNLSLYGDLTGIELHLEAMGGQRDPIAITFEAVRGELAGLRASLWGLFGWFGILMPDWVYIGLDVLMALGLLGLLLWFLRDRTIARWLMGMMLLWLALVAISLARWTLITSASQGRLLFPALPALALVLAVGWGEWARFGRGWRDLPPIIVAVGLLALSAVVPWTVIAPAYARPPLLEVDALPADLSRLEVHFGDQVYLHGCQTHVARLEPGDTLQVTCYWQALEPLAHDYYVYHHLLGRDLEPVGKEHGYPGSGGFPTSLWPVGKIVANTEWLLVDQSAATPVLGRLSVGVLDPEGDELLTPLASQGAPLELVIAGEVKIAAPEGQTIPIPNPVHYSVGDLATLVGYEVEPGEVLQVKLYWEPSAVPPEDYTVFVHLLDETGELRGQGDSPPMNGDYPTSIWEPGELIVDEHPVEVDPDAPPGIYQLAVGLYRPADGTRLPVWDAAGVPQPEDRIILPLEIR